SQRPPAREARSAVLHAEDDTDGQRDCALRGIVRTSRVHRCRGDEGTFIVVWALLLVGLLTMVAIVIDLGDARATRRTDQTTADFSSLAAGDNLLTNLPQACADAWAYIRQNVSDLPSVAGTPCGVLGSPSTAFPAT